MKIRSTYICYSCFVAALLAFPSLLLAANCDAYFPFDGNLKDSGDNGFHGQMIGKKGDAINPVFVAGRSGQALQLGDYGVMRAFLDLHFERCPQVTITAWLKVDASDKRSRSIVSTGSGHGPGIRASGKGIFLNGPANGLYALKVIRDDNNWFFVAGVWDYTANSYTLYWRTRKVHGTFRENHRPPEEAMWVGAHTEKMGTPARGVVIDDLKVFGRALGADEVQALRLNNE